jgi:hypothetical protein
MNTLRKNIIDAINELNKLLHLSITEEEKITIRKKRRLLFLLLEEVIEQQIDPTSPDFSKAIKALKNATKSAIAAKDDISQVAETIKKVTTAAKLVEKIVKTGISIST